MGYALRERLYPAPGASGGARGPTAKDAERMGKRKPPVFPEPVWKANQHTSAMQSETGLTWAQAIKSRPPATMGIEYF